MLHRSHPQRARDAASRARRCRAVRAATRALWLALVCAASQLAAAAPPGEIKLASWNLEWLLAPGDFHRLAPLCTPAGGETHRGRRAMPCDVAANLERSGADIAALRRYALRLDADVVALQEVDGPAAARQLFSDYHFCFTRSPALQNTGFAVRNGLPFRCDADLAELSLGDQVRRGARLTLFPGTGLELHLLGVHLKSGCARPSATARGDACARLAQQVPVLRRWIAGESAAGHAFALLGDFNRDLLHERRDAGQTFNLWAELNGGDARVPPLLNAASGTPFHNCVAGQNHRGYIDQILLGGRLAARMVPGSFRHEGYDPGDAVHYLLSDHCPVSVRLKLKDGH